MRKIFVYMILISAISVSANAERYCIYNGSVMKSCLDSLGQCKKYLNQNLARDEECRKEVDNHIYPSTIDAKDPRAFCIWAEAKGELKNLGCMEKAVCEYSMRKYPHTVCVKGIVKDKIEIRKAFMAHENVVRSDELAAKSKVAAQENAILTKGSPDEITKHIEDKFGRLGFTTPEAVAGAQKKLEPFCVNENPKACFVLHDLYGLSDFKNAWNRSATAQCAELKKSYEYLYRSCALGYYKACESVPTNSDEQDGSIFIREPNQNGLANDEAKGVDCKKPEVPQAVSTMKEKCESIERGADVELCVYTKTANVPLEKMSYEQLVAAGKNARNFKKSSDAIAFYEKACEKKKGSRACIDLAIDVHEIDPKKGRSIFNKFCSGDSIEKEVKSDCENLSRDFMSGE